MKFDIVKGQISFLLKRRLGKSAYVVVRPFEAITDFLFQRVK
jgi:hypothetical protein